MTTLPQALPKPQSVSRAHCDLDNWDFDPRYTEGACPICGWVPPGPTRAAPVWETRLAKVPWDLVLLGILAIVLVALGVLVGIAAHINLLPRS